MRNQRVGTTSVVNELIETCNEREAGYKKAAEHAKDFQHRNLFNMYAEQSAKFAKELLPYSDEESTEEIGTGPLSSIFRGWADFKAILTQENPRAIIDWCITGEEAALQVYDSAFKSEIASGAFEIARKHYAEFKEAIKQLKGLIHE